jgi:hypothetical protein
MSSIILKTEKRSTLVPRSKVRNVVADVYANGNEAISKTNSHPTIKVTKKVSTKKVRAKK